MEIQIKSPVNHETWTFKLTKDKYIKLLETALKLGTASKENFMGV